MQIHVRDVPPEGVTQRATYDPAGLDLERPDVRLPEPFEAQAFVSMADHELIADVAIRATLQMTCSRCLNEFTDVVTPTAIFSYKVQPSDTVDLTEDVRQELLLSYPIVPRCRADCKGLCSVCGQDLNTGTCGHTSSD